MKNKFLSKMMMVALIFCSMFLISACSLQKDVNIETIEINKESIPEFIRVGEFDDAEIELVINYDDGSKEEVFVTTSMLSSESQECLQTPGIYEIEILFKGEKTILNITIVQASTYLVEFYNGKQQLINRQFVEKHSDAIAPMESTYAMFGYDFIGWDRLFTDVTEDIKVYGVYSKLTTEDMNTFVHGKMVNAFAYMYSHNYVATVGGMDAEIVYHEKSVSGEPVSQVVLYENGELEAVSNHTKDGYSEYWHNSETGTWEVESGTMNEYDSEEKKILAVMTAGGEGLGILFDKNSIITYDYMLTENRNIYTVEISPADIPEDIIEKLVLTFDDEKMLSYKSIREGSYDDLKFELLIDYRTEDFITIVDQNLFLKLYNEARENVFAQTTLRYEEIEVDENLNQDGYHIIYNIDGDEIYSTSTNHGLQKKWIQKEGDNWYCYSQESIYNQKYEVSDAIIDDNLVRYVSDGQLVEFDANVVATVDCFECYFEKDYTKLTITVVEDDYEMQMIYYIENVLITRIEQIMLGDNMLWTILYGSDNVEMVELPTDVEWDVR